MQVWYVKVILIGILSMFEFLSQLTVFYDFQVKVPGEAEVVKGEYEHEVVDV